MRFHAAVAEPATGRTIELPDEAASARLAADLASILRTGDIVALSGDLGAGKTTLARALIRQAAGEPELEVPSPTYTLAQTYETQPKITHFDLYRLGDASELEELGFEEAAETGIVIVEWPERAPAILEDANLRLSLDMAPGGGRVAQLETTPELALRLGHSLSIRRFLDRAGYMDAVRRPFPADASVRRYERILAGPRSMILMDAPAQEPGPPVRDGLAYTQIAHIARDVRPFVAVAQALAGEGFTAPAILSADIENGLLLLEDLGTEGILSQEGRPLPERYLASAQALAQIHARDFTRPIATRHGFDWQIPPFDRAAMSIEVELLPEWFWPRARGQSPAPADREAFRTAWAALFEKAAKGRQTLVLRDFHSPNIIWQADKAGAARIGLLDFQDSMIGPAAYDLASLAQDARVDVPADLEKDVVNAYIAECDRIGTPLDRDAFTAQYAIMAAQRATKLLGLFVRLHERDGKPQYLRHIPRIQDYLSRSLAHPVNAGLKAIYDEWGVV
ncbi:tRNA (adenosine(37)-N6)-threonylcarbamoyltransferase complex ATPase subunit type 1 TsaE [Aureimonas frigidaquae]|uniref:tRNA threonylcarbamoyladenosine biosynthesis protein TsaE n=1 Tax=Aureimonas frigidaquae TaxID=424757 RepID=A0A0P0Z006_9HYPH|nr:tRNA (adenosine(37)-N6)-threonylcarbamoyltransferase complex ATPase subunit type 1 TsaE [Aureimonas frigidaquae]BAT27179.1 hypothetical protein [Aureimonas frigidaquae]